MTFVSRNLLNPEDIDTFLTDALQTKAKALETHPFIEKWVQTTYARHLKAELDAPLVKQVLSGRQTRDPLFRAMMRDTDNQRFIAAEFVRVENEASLPDWAKVALEENNLFKVDLSNVTALRAVKSRLHHIIDWMVAEVPKRDICRSIEEVTESVATWDKKLARKRRDVIMTKDCQEIPSRVLDLENARNERSLYLVRLETKEAYEAEGSVMRHCVSTYFGVENTVIYSLRDRSQQRPLYTIETDTEGAFECVMQVKGYRNIQVDPKDQAVLLALFQERSWEDSTGCEEFYTPGECENGL